MKIFTLNKELMKSINSKEIESSSLLALINSRDKIEDIFVNTTKPKLLKDLPNDYEVIVLDFMEDIKHLVQFQDVYFSKEAMGALVLREPTYKNKCVEIDPITLDIEIYSNMFNILFNKLLREYEGRKIVFLDIEINSEEKIVNKQKIQLNEEERKDVEETNNYLKKITTEVKKQLPNITIVKIEKKVYFTNVINREVEIENIEDIEDVVISEINNKKHLKNEKVFTSTKNIRYIYEKSIIYNKEKLVIIFSAFSNDVAKYNYINTLKCIDCNKLFILDDYGTKGTYYLGLDGKLDIETSVMALISFIMSKENITFNNVISVGSSKGGTAALYFGLKYNFGNIIAGAPQYKVGTYLSDLSIKEYAKDIFGEINQKTRINYNNIIRLVSNNYVKKNIYLLTSDGDNQYKKVLKEFEFISEEFNLNIKIDKCNINTHNEIAKEFPNYLNENLVKILGLRYINNKVVKKIINIIKKAKNRGN